MKNHKGTLLKTHRRTFLEIGYAWGERTGGWMCSQRVSKELSSGGVRSSPWCGAYKVREGIWLLVCVLNTLTYLLPQNCLLETTSPAFYLPLRIYPPPSSCFCAGEGWRVSSCQRTPWPSFVSPGVRAVGGICRWLEATRQVIVPTPPNSLSTLRIICPWVGPSLSRRNQLFGWKHWHQANGDGRPGLSRNVRELHPVTRFSPLFPSC